MGAVESTVNLALSVLPPNFIAPGFFLAACFISLSRVLRSERSWPWRLWLVGYRGPDRYAGRVHARGDGQRGHVSG